MKTKFKTLTNLDSSTNSINNFNNSQNYIINQRWFFANYILYIDWLEKKYWRYLLYILSYSILLAFWGINNIINNYQDDIKNFEFPWKYFVFWWTLLMLLVYFLFIFKPKLFLFRRLKLYFVKKMNIEDKVKILKK